MTVAASPDAPPRRTDPRGFIVNGLTALLRGGVPALAALIGTGTISVGLLVLAPVAVAVLAASFGVAWLQWSRLTYTTGADTIRVEKGLLSRHARAVPYDRIQDVSLEEKLLPRLFGLAEVRFETGAGGKDEITLAYLALAEARRLRELVRARRSDGLASAQEHGAEGENLSGALSEASPEDDDPGARVLFAMDTRRVFTFGLFEFSLVIFAVLLGASQQLEFLLPFDPWEWEQWSGYARRGQDELAFLAPGSAIGAAIAAVSALAALTVIGLATGVARTFAREHGFTLTRTDRGFRRRRGLFTRTDVVLPVHRVQAARIGTGFLRRRFGWHGLRLVSLASDSKDASHVVAPFATMDEIAPVLGEAGFYLPPDALDWRRSSRAYWADQALLFGVPAVIGAGIAAGTGFWLVSAGLLLLATLESLRAALRWRLDRHAHDAVQIFVRRRWFAPELDIGVRTKVQSVDIVQGPIARRRGYAVLHFGIAGGSLSIAGLPVAEARTLARAVMDSAAALDFAHLPR